MPKITSLGANKETIVPLSSRAKKPRTVGGDDDADDVVGLSKVRRAKGGSSSRQAGATRETGREGAGAGASSSSDPAPSRRQRDANELQQEEDEEGRSEQERLLADRVAMLIRERDEVQGQFDDLRELRLTEPERVLAEWKKMADERDSQAEAYIAALKAQIKAFESGRDPKSSSSGGSTDSVPFRRENHDESQARERKLEQEVARLSNELATSSLALKGRLGSGNIGSNDERAIRRLYEDLTGLVISKVELVSGKEKSNLRSYHAIFASMGYYNLEMKLDESESNVPSSDGTHPRQDLVYTPALDPDRDAEILASGRLPSWLKESLRIERPAGVRFMNTLHKKLDRQSKRAN